MKETKQWNGLEPLMPYEIRNEQSEKNWLMSMMKPVRWLMSKMKLVGVACVLIVLATVGCTKTITVKPVCNTPDLKPLPVIMSSDMECISDEVYWALMDRERLLTDWALQMKATLDVVCD